MDGETVASALSEQAQQEKTGCVELVKHYLHTASEQSQLLQFSTKQITPDLKGILQLLPCYPTYWTVSASSLKNTLSNYSALHGFVFNAKAPVHAYRQKKRHGCLLDSVAVSRSTSTTLKNTSIGTRSKCCSLTVHAIEIQKRTYGNLCNDSCKAVHNLTGCWHTASVGSCGDSDSFQIPVAGTACAPGEPTSCQFCTPMKCIEIDIGKGRTEPKMIENEATVCTI